MLGWCDARAGQQKLAVAAMRNAQRRDPDDWHYAYGLAVDAGAGGGGPAAGRGPGAAPQPARAADAITLERRLRSEQPGAAAGGGRPLADPVRLAVNDERRAGARLS